MTTVMAKVNEALKTVNSHRELYTVLRLSPQYKDKDMLIQHVIDCLNVLEEKLRDTKKALVNGHFNLASVHMTSCNEKYSMLKRAIKTLNTSK